MGIEFVVVVDRNSMDTIEDRRYSTSTGEGELYKDQGRTDEPRRAGSNQILSATRPVNAEGLSLFYI